MKNLPMLLTVLLLALLFTTCQKQETFPLEPTTEETFDLQALIQNTPVNPDAIALEILGRTNWPQTMASPLEKAYVQPGKVLSYEKTYVTEDIAHYAFVLAGGDGEYDKIGLHRVVKESGGKPVHTYHNLFYQHGDAKDFTGMMLPGQLSPNTPDDFGMAVYLARNNVDVWGIDQAWTLVPAEVTDHSFMEDWGIDRQVRDLEIAMAVARVLRLRTGFGAGRMILAGYSSGVPTGFATLNYEAGRESLLRQVKGFISVDVPIKIADEGLKAYFASDYQYASSLIEEGEYGYFIVFKLMAELASTSPDDPSPVFTGLTNMQAALFMAAGNIYGENVTSHFLAADWTDGLPAELKYLSIEQWLDFMMFAPVWEAAPFIRDYCMWIGEIAEVPWDDHFADITVPILGVNPIGGFGRDNPYVAAFLGSKDITQLNIQLLPEEEALYDFAHIDLFLANNAEELAWQPILEWIKNH